MWAAGPPNAVVPSFDMTTATSPTRLTKDEAADYAGLVRYAVVAGQKEIDKHLARTVNTGEDGSYTLPNLPIGPYRLEVRMAGFKDYVQNGIVLQVNSNIQINPTMQVGSISEHLKYLYQSSTSLTKPRWRYSSQSGVPR